MADDRELKKEIAEETKKLADYLNCLEIKTDIIISDWKDKGGHAEASAEFLQKHPGWFLYYFDDWYSFEGGSGDDVITVFTSKSVEQEVAEKIANWYYNLGAELPEEQPEEQPEGPKEPVMAGCSHCPTCGGKLNQTGERDEPATTHETYECSACGLGWEANYQKGVEELLLSIHPVT